jgi:hypothetical protein
MAEHRRRAERRRESLRLAHSEQKGRVRLRALRRIYRDELRDPRPDRRPALVLAAVFVALALALLVVAKASGGPSGITLAIPDRQQTPEGPSRQTASVQGLNPRDAARLRPSPTAVRSAICSVFIGTRCGPAIRVATCETGGTLDPHSRGSLGERGLFQIHPVHFRTFDRRRLFEVLYNIRAAFRLSRGGLDWSPWTCRP